MPLVDDLLIPIEGENPSGADLRYEDIYSKIKEARREEAVPPPGMTESDRKVADNPLVIKLATEALTKKTKDLWLAAWLTEAWVKQNGFGGLKDGLTLCHDMVEKFWDTLYPAIEDGDVEMRAAPLEFLGTRLELPLKGVRLVQKQPYGFTDVKESRKLGYEADAKSDEAKQSRSAAIADGKVALEVLDKCFEETPKVFYAQAEKDLDACIELLPPLKESADAKFGDAGPSFGPLESILAEVRQLVHGFLQKKREKEPDPVEEGQAAAAAEGGEGAAGVSGETIGRSGPAGIVIPFGDKEPAERRGAIAAVASAAAALRKLDPTNPGPYLMMRGLRWGELRAALSKQDMTLLEGPPTELRQHVKRLAIEGKWDELLEATENSMSLPCSRGWLDLQKYAVDACAGLGGDYSGIAIAIRSELKTLARDVPQALEVTLLDDTPAANSETRSWLQELVAETPTPAAEAAPTPEGAPAEEGAPVTEAAIVENHSKPGWHRKFADGYDVANEALKAGQMEKAIATMMQEVDRQLSGRGQFFRKLQLVEICAAAGKPEIAEPIIEDLSALIENNHLETWENPKTIAKALVMIMKNSQRVKEDEREKQRLFQKVVRLDPVQAIASLGS
ncbi:MAG: type VI secretion system protein TssA [Terriglobia bacterium]